MAGPGRPRKPVTPEMVITMVAELERGMSIEGAANLVGISAKTLERYRHDDEELDASILSVRARYEQRLTAIIDEQQGTMAAATAAAERARSFPWRHGDPKIRNRVNEQRLEDAGEETPADRGATSLAEAIAMVLGAKKSGAL